jgi:hypothetical protein
VTLHVPSSERRELGHGMILTIMTHAANDFKTPLSLSKTSGTRTQKRGQPGFNRTNFDSARGLYYLQLEQARGLGGRSVRWDAGFPEGSV